MLGHETRSIGDVRTNRREFNQDGVTVIQEPGRTIVREDDRVFIRHDENDRFRDLGGDMRSERRGNEIATIYRRPDGDEIVTVTDENGYLLRRIRRDRDGREVVIIDNGFREPPRSFEDEVVVLPPPLIEIPRDRYVVDAGGADESVIHEALFAPPLSRLPRRYTLDEVRNSASLRAYTRSVDLDTINFDSGSWALSQDQGQRLAGIAGALNEAIRRNPSEVFLIEGHTDATPYSSDASYSNWDLSADRANSARRLMQQDGVRADQVTQVRGYADQMLRVKNNPTDPSNRRVSILVKNDNESVPTLSAAKVVDGTTPLPGAVKSPIPAEAGAKPQGPPPAAESAPKPAAQLPAQTPAKPSAGTPLAKPSAGSPAKPSAGTPLAKPGLLDRLKNMLPGAKK